MNAPDQSRNPMKEASTHAFLFKKRAKPNDKTVRRNYEITRAQDKKIKQIALDCQCPEYRIIQRILDQYLGAIEE